MLRKLTADPSELDFDVTFARGAFTLRIAHRVELKGIVALYGQNGSGKSTLLRILAGLEPGARGHVRFAGTPWQDDAANVAVLPHRRGVGFIFQEPRLFPHLDVAGNLAFAARRAPRAETSRDHAVTHEAVVAALELGRLLTRRPGELSGGERQRVALARALLSRPRVLFLDEPLSAVDNRRRLEILDYIGRLPALFGIPMIYVTHALDEVVRLADHMMLLSDGRLAAHGPTETVLERIDLAPATGRFEAGVMLRAIVARHDPAYQLTELVHLGEPAAGGEPGPRGQSLWVPLVDAMPGTEFRLRIRARDVTLAINRPTGVSTRNVVEGTLVEVRAEPETAFAETLIDIGGARLRARLTRKSIDELALGAGVRVFAMIKSISLDRIIPLD